MLEGQEERIEKWKYLMNSMTKEELENPDIIKGNRLDRIAKGAAIDISELRQLLKQYKQSKKLMRTMKGMDGSEKDMQKMMQKMQKGGMKNLKF